MKNFYYIYFTILIDWRIFILYKLILLIFHLNHQEVYSHLIISEAT